MAAGRIGRLAIGFTGSATYELLPSLARALRKDFPELDLDLKVEKLTADQVTALLEKRLDLGFLRPPVRDHRLDVHVLRREPLIAVLHEAHVPAAYSGVDLTDLRDGPFICYPSDRRSVVYEAVYDACQHVGFSPMVLHQVAETSTLVQAHCSQDRHGTRHEPHQAQAAVIRVEGSLDAGWLRR